MMTLHRSGKSPERLEFPYEGNGYQFEAAEVMCCLREGRLESVAIVRTMVQRGAPWGLRYPSE